MEREPLSDAEIDAGLAACERDERNKTQPPDPVDPLHQTDAEMDAFSQWWDRDVYLAEAARTILPRALEELKEARRELMIERGAGEAVRVASANLLVEMQRNESEAMARADRAEAALAAALQRLECCEVERDCYRDKRQEAEAALAAERTITTACNEIRDRLCLSLTVANEERDEARRNRDEADADCVEQAQAAGRYLVRAEKAEAALAGYEQTSGDECPACGWRGIRGDDGCAFCLAAEAKANGGDRG